MTKNAREILNKENPTKRFSWREREEEEEKNLGCRQLLSGERVSTVYGLRTTCATQVDNKTRVEPHRGRRSTDVVKYL